MKYLANTSLFNYLPHSFKVDNFNIDEDEIYTLAHDITIASTNIASELTGLHFEDFDEEREEVIEFVINKLVEENSL
jgi:hypothetical protein